MIVIRSEKGKERAIELIKLANKFGAVIICIQLRDVKYIRELANELNIKIPIPRTLKYHIFNGAKKKPIIVNDIDELLRDMFSDDVLGYATEQEREVLEEGQYYKIWWTEKTKPRLALWSEGKFHNFNGTFSHLDDIHKVDYNKVLW